MSSFEKFLDKLGKMPISEAIKKTNVWTFEAIDKNVFSLRESLVFKIIELTTFNQVATYRYWAFLIFENYPKKYQRTPRNKRDVGLYIRRHNLNEDKEIITGFIIAENKDDANRLLEEAFCDFDQDKMDYIQKTKDTRYDKCKVDNQYILKEINKKPWLYRGTRPRYSKTAPWDI